LGGTGRKTREALILLEAAGFDIIIVETVGVGQSEVAVKSMVDVFVLLALPNTGDELQGIKRGIMEATDLIVLNKVEASNLASSRAALSSYRSTISLLPLKGHGLRPKVVSCSSIEGPGIDLAFKEILEYLQKIEASSFLEKQRIAQYATWLEAQIQERLLESFSMSEAVVLEIKNQKKLIETGQSNPFSAAEKIVDDFLFKNLS
jgi:LAO/AO transport system kinase